MITTIDSQAAVWVVDGNSRATRKIVTIGATTADALVEVVNGLHPTDKLIASGTDSLRDGMAVRIRGEDRTLGF